MIKLMSLFGKPKCLTPINMDTLQIGDTVRNIGTMELATVVMINTHKVTYRTNHGQYSMLPEDFVMHFTLLKEVESGRG